MNENIKKMIKGKKIIGVGSRRVVYDLGNRYVLKVAKSKYGVTSNRKEINIYKASPSPIRKYLATIKKYGSGWVVMKKYSRNFPKSKEYEQKLYKLKSKFRENGITPFEIFSTFHKKPNWENVRLKPNGEIVVIDYGNFEYRHNPMIGATKPKEKMKDKFVYDEFEIMEVFEALQNEDKHQFRMMIALALTTGMRCAEIIGLKWNCVDLEKGVLKVRQSIPLRKNVKSKGPKNKGSVRNIPLPDSIVEELKYYKEYTKDLRLKVYHMWLQEDPNRSFVFDTWTGRPLNQKKLWEWWWKFHKRNPQLKYIRFRDMRHTAETLFINQGVHAKFIPSRLGLSNTMNVHGLVIESTDRATASKFDSQIPAWEAERKKMRVEQRLKDD
jgi:integrase